MKKGKFSVVEKHFIRRLFVFGIVQLFILLTFAYCFVHSQPIDANKVKTTNIVVEDARIRHHGKQQANQLLIYSDSDRFLLTDPAKQEELTATELYDTVSVGDKWHISYIETWFILYGKTNLVVEAQNEATVYRTLDSYNQSKHGVTVFVVVIGLLLEIIYFGVVFISFWLNRKTVQQIGKKTKRNSCKS